MTLIGTTRDVAAETRASRKQRPAKAPKAAKVKAPPAPQGTVLPTGVKPRRKYLDRVGWYEISARGISTSTRQAEALRLGIAARAGSERALVLGVDLETGEIVFSDPISDYAMKDGPRSPTRLINGDVGYGKSTFVKTSGCLRPLMLGRRVAVVDKKPQGGAGAAEGEYAPIARRLGQEPLRFALDGTGLKINVLDPRIAARTGANRAAGQTDLLRAILVEALGRPLGELEGKAMRVAHRAALEAAAERGRIADIRSLIEPLMNPVSTSGVKAGELRRWGLECAFALERMIEEDLEGLIDGPTDERVELGHALTVFDVSALPETGPSTSIAMAIINTWLTNELRNQRAIVPTHFAIEEGWHLVQGSFANVAQRNSKLARGLAMVPEYAIHHFSDIPVESPAMAMCREAGTVLMFKQANRADADAAAGAYNLPAGTAEQLMSLDVGTALLWQSGRRPRYIQVVRSDLERDLADTDGAMLSTATMRDLIDLEDDTNFGGDSGGDGFLPTLEEAMEMHS